jgi:ATP-dependent DNA helicase DinG
MPLDRPEFVRSVGEHLEGLRTSVASMASRVQRALDSGAGEDRRLRRLESAVGRLAGLAEEILMLSAFLTSEAHVQSYRVRHGGWSLLLQELDVSGSIRGNLYETKRAVVYTSATLSQDGDFSSFRSIVGLPDGACSTGEGILSRPAAFARIASPFGPETVEIFVPDGAVNGRFANKEAWLRSVTELLPPLIREHNGSTLVLFASYEDLFSVTRRVSGELEAMSLPLLVQQRGAPTAGLCEEFRTVKDSVLFGVETFWHGVDFRGETLTQVVITRIPFPSPMDPVQQARKRVLSPEDYWRRYRYDTQIKMLQGIGRLVRGESDTGRVVVLDRRFSGIRPEQPHRI